LPNPPPGDPNPDPNPIPEPPGNSPPGGNENTGTWFWIRNQALDGLEWIGEKVPDPPTFLKDGGKAVKNFNKENPELNALLNALEGTPDFSKSLLPFQNNWEDMTPESKHAAIAALFKDLANFMQIEKGLTLDFTPSCSLKAGADGSYWYGTNTICLSQNLLLNPGLLLYSLSHEMTHAWQYQMISTNPDLAQRLGYPEEFENTNNGALGYWGERSEIEARRFGNAFETKICDGKSLCYNKYRNRGTI
jgi:hypothetical protein